MGVSVDITERKLAEQALEERLQFETLLAEISSRFVNVPADRIDGEIEGAQRRICELLDIDRSTLWQIADREPGALQLTHVHQPPGILFPPERMNARDFFPWTAQKVLDGETVAVSKMTDLPPEAGLDREIFSRTAPSPPCWFRYQLEKGRYLACWALLSLVKRETGPIRS